MNSDARRASLVHSLERDAGEGMTLHGAEHQHRSSLAPRRWSSCCCRCSAFRLPFRRDEGGVQAPLRTALGKILKRLDQSCSCRLVPGACDFRRTGSEELLLLQLDPLPRRIAEHDIETAAGHDVREFQRPVEGPRAVQRSFRVLHEQAEGPDAAQVPGPCRRRCRRSCPIHRRDRRIRRFPGGSRARNGGPLPRKAPRSSRTCRNAPGRPERRAKPRP